MDQQALPRSSRPIVSDELSFAAPQEMGDPDEVPLQDLLSSEAVVQQANMRSVQMPFQVQHSGGSLSQPGELDLEDFAGWEDFLAAEHMAAPDPIPLQTANNMKSDTAFFQTPACSSNGWMYPNAMQPCLDVAGQQTELDRNLLLDAPLIETPSAVGRHNPYYDVGRQPINFELIQEPASLPVPHISSTHSARALTRLQTTIDSVSSDPLQVPRFSGILATGPFDFAEIERRAIQAPDYVEWQQAGQVDGSSFDSTNLNALQIPEISGIGARSTHGGQLTPPSQMVLATRYREPPQSVTPATYNRHLQIPPPHAAEIAPATSSQAHILVPFAVASRNSSTQLTLKLSNKAIRKPSRDNKHSKRQKVGAIESLPGYQVYALEPLGPLKTVKKHNSRFGKQRSSSEKLAREKGACILCRHRNKKVC